MQHDPAQTAARRRIPTSVFQRTRYVVGIDLGTTNSALAFVDRRAGVKAREVRHFPVEQLIEPGIVKAGRVLPSALYLRGEELSPAQVALPWQGGDVPVVVGTLARKRGALTPDRLITSAKSWLCHAGVDRTAPILPWGAGEAIPHRSPVEVQAELLRHLRDAWNHAQAQDDESRRLDKQDLVVTIPASFDEVARELTVMATRQAGLDALLIEEPQAALYAWIATHEQVWTEVLKPGETILVCDVGGGTTDFSLFQVTPPDPAEDDEEAAGKPGFVRTAVGDHLLLGGDNMDLTLARQVEQRLGAQLDARGWNALVQACRDAKETLLESGEPVAQVALAGKGSRLIGGTLRAEVKREEVLSTIIDGFFPLVRPDEAPARGGAGLREFGLPYENDPAITRHLAAFLRRHGGDDGALPRIDHVLFNGGVFRTRLLRERVLDAIGSWQPRPHELEGSDLDLAVSLGAAYYGLVRRGKGTRIKSGAGRAYYLEVGARGRRERTAVCLIPRGLDEGGVVTIKEHPLELQANLPVVFPFWSSTSRDDPAGALVRLDEEFQELAPLHTVIRAGKKRTARVKTVPVELVARYTELGTLEMWAQSKEMEERRWRLELDTRPRQGEAQSFGPPPAEEAGASATASATAEGRDELPPEQATAGFDPAALEKARKHLITAFRIPAAEAARPLEQLGKELEELLGGAREGWPVPVIRNLFDLLLEERGARRRSPAHEARWTNLAGFCLRPGFGAALDFGRVSAMWKVWLEGMAHPNKDAVRLEWWVAWRRIAGGLHRGQQETLFAPVQPYLLGHKHDVSKQELAEMWRLAANLEHLAPKKRRQLGDLLLDQLRRGKAPPRWGPWALGRLGGRVPLYGPLDRLVPADVAAGWLERLLELDLSGPEATFACVQLGRLTGDRARDVPAELRAKALARLSATGVDPRSLRPLEAVVESEVRTQAEFYGDSVPFGLVLQAAPSAPGSPAG